MFSNTTSECWGSYSEINLKAPNKNCSRRHFNFLPLSFEENKVWFFHVNPLPSRGFTWSTKSYFLWKNNEKIFMNVVRCSVTGTLRAGWFEYSLNAHSLIFMVFQSERVLVDFACKFLVYKLCMIQNFEGVTSVLKLECGSTWWSPY